MTQSESQPEKLETPEVTAPSAEILAPPAEIPPDAPVEVPVEPLPPAPRHPLDEPMIEVPIVVLEDRLEPAPSASSAFSAPAENLSTPAAWSPPSDTSADLDAMPLVPVLEALLFAIDAPLSAGKLAETLGMDTTKSIKEAIEELNAGYAARKAAYRIEERAGGYQLLTLPQYAQYVQRLMRKKDEGRLTPSMLETLAIIAYKQPILRVEIEAIRGVACGDGLRTLMEHNLVKIVGRAEEVGRPMLYGTTRHFLELFGLATLKDLPKVEQLKELSGG